MIADILGKMEPIIGKHSGFIDKYIGDAIMALFPTNADDAIQGAIAMLKTLNNYNLERKSNGYKKIKIGIGLNTGKLMLGTVGGKNRMDSTVISDAVNLASRVEGLTQRYDAPLLITMQTYEKLKKPNKYKIRLIDAIKVKGKSEDVTVYEVFDNDSSENQKLKIKSQSKFKQGFMSFQLQKFKDAKLFFENVLKINPNDKAAQIYLKRCQYYQKCGIPKDWDGIENLTSK